MVTQLDFIQVWDGLCHAGYWSVAVIAIWVFLYIFNTFSWYIIINAGGRTKVSFWWLYKITISGFALNYATPGGLMGGEPYRIMSLSPIIGTERASSSVILFAMTHIFSHFWFWTISIVLYLVLYPVGTFMVTLLGAISIFCLLGLWFFIAGYRKGLAVRTMNVLRHIPFAKGWAKRFVTRHQQQLDTIDSQIASLHKQNTRTFVTAVLSELTCRICSAAEIYFVLRVLRLHTHTCLYLAFRQSPLLHSPATRRTRRRISHVRSRTRNESQRRSLCGSHHPSARTDMDRNWAVAH